MDGPDSINVELTEWTDREQAAASGGNPCRTVTEPRSPRFSLANPIARWQTEDGVRGRRWRSEVAETGGTEKLAVLRQMIALQSKVCYMNVDRTLASWTRTALALIVFGTVFDRYGLLLTRDHLKHVGTRLAPNPLSSIGGIVLVVLGVSMVVTAAIRHQAYRATWHRVYGRGEPFGPWLACTFALMVAIFGICILAVLLVDAR